MIKDIELWKNNESLDEDSKSELNALNNDELYDAFYKDISFGTGGMRGIIGVGTNRINIYTLRKANYGYFEFLKNHNNGSITVAIAYDCRHKSKEFAIDSAKTLASLGAKVYLFDKITPTPALSFAVRYLKASGGIVITASHNPPKYNGYKIYDNDGCQLVPALANEVIENISKAPSPFSLKLLSFDEYIKDGKIEMIGAKIENAYLERVKELSINQVNKKDFKVVFTPLHGTSAYLGTKLLNELGYNYYPVKEQMIPDPNFSTVVLPNPEDNRAFDYSVKLARNINADICIATDPDADRIGIAVKNNNEYVLLNGNQTGALLIYYLVNNRKFNKKGVIFNTIVTSPLGAIIGESHGLRIKSTLTGFKFIGEQAKLLEDSKEEAFYFGYEESFGYVIGDFVRDKDSLQAILLCSEMACFYKNKGKTLVDVLKEIYGKYGYYTEDLISISLEGVKGEERINSIMDYFRNNDKVINLNIIRKEDYQISKGYDLSDNKTYNIDLPKSNVLKFYLNDNSWFVLRPSGTEPKLKIYLSVVRNNKEDSIITIKQLHNELINIIDRI